MAQGTKAVQVEVEGDVMVVTLNRPPANALDTATSTELHEAFRQLNVDDALRVGILAGATDPKKIFARTGLEGYGARRRSPRRAGL